MVSSIRLFAVLIALTICPLLAPRGVRAQAQDDSHAVESQPAPPTIVFMTDFGTANDAVAICRAVIFSIAPPNLRLTDITHQVTPFSIEEGSRFLAAVTPYYPAGTVFLVVVDPGVGTSRKAVVVKTKKGQYFVLPDNGVITPVVDRDGLDSAHEITNPKWMIQAAVSSTFHGRDIFSPAAAHLAAGWDFTQAGPEVPKLVALTTKTSKTTEKGIEGDIIGLDDPFGSLITNIPGEEFKKLGYTLGENSPSSSTRSRSRFRTSKPSMTCLSANRSCTSIRAVASASPITKATTPRLTTTLPQASFLFRAKARQPSEQIKFHKGRIHEPQLQNS